MTLRFSSFKFGRFCGQFLALVLVLFALMVSLIRGLLPQLDAARIEQYVAQQYGVQIELGQLSAKWQAYGPSVAVNSVELPQQGDLPVSLSIRDVQIKLDFWQTLLQLSPQIENVNFGDVYLSLDLDKIADEPAEPVPVDDKPAKARHLDWLYALLLEQLQQYAINNATVQLVSSSHQYRPIELKQLRWLNHGERHQASGALFLDSAPQGGEHLSLNVDLRGNGNKPNSIKGQLYLAANQLNLGAWASEHSKALNEPLSTPLQGVVNLQAWIDVEQRRIQRGLVQFGHSVLDWQQHNAPQNFTIDGGQLLWQQQANGWQLSSKDLNFSSNQQPWQDFSLYLAKHQQQLFGHVSHIDLQWLKPLLPLLPAIQPAALQQLLALNAKGDITELQLYQAPQGPLQLHAPIRGANWQAVAAIPGSKALDVDLAVNGSFISASLPKQQYQLSFIDQFSHDMTLNGAAMQLGFDASNQQLIVPSLQLENSDIALDASAVLSLKEQADLSLTAALKLHKLANAHRYFPLNAMSSSLVDYLTQAIQAGYSDDARVVWHGALADFPYAEQQGVFQAAFTLQQGTFAFQPNWPIVDKLTLDALFDNAAMQLDVVHGMLKNVDISGAEIGIPAMGAKSELAVNAKLHANGPDINQVMNLSPLTSVSSTLNIVNIQDAIDGELALNIPLYAGGTPDVRGKVQLADNSIYLAKPGVMLTKLNGEVSFANEDIHTDELRGEMYQQPLRLDFSTGRVNDNFGVTIHLDGAWNLANLPTALNNPMQPFYAGNMDWKGYLQLIFDPSGFRIQANADADLTNTDLTLPPPFAKQHGTPLKVSAELLGDDKQASLDIRMADLAEFWGSFDAKEDNLKHYDIMLGRPFRSGDKLSKNDGKLLLALDAAQFDEWQPVIESFIHFGKQQASATPKVASTPESDDVAAPAANALSTATAAKRGFFPPLRAIGGEIAQLDMLGQRFNKVNLAAHDTQLSWLFDINAPAFVGSIEIFPDWLDQGVKLVASKVHLTATPPLLATTEPVKAESDDVVQLPPLALDISDFSYQGFKLGHLVMQGAPADTGYHIQTFSLDAPQGNLQGSGDWITHSKNRTSVQFALKSDNFEQLASIFDVTPGVKDSPLELNAELNWQGGPTAFNLPSLSGKVRFDLGKGHMEQLSDKGARIFSLFSLDSLLRKLSLDFSDVFGKGLYFNSFGGDLALDNGLLKTTNTEMDAVAGNMKVRGYTNLVSESLNYDIRFAPKLASSVPTVVLLSTSAWTMGIGAFALTKVLEPVIEVVSEIRFRLTGTIGQPKLEELERKSKEIEIPKSILPADKQTPAATDNAADAKVQDEKAQNEKATDTNGADKASSSTSPAAKAPVATSAVQPTAITPIEPTKPAAMPQHDATATEPVASPTSTTPNPSKAANVAPVVTPTVTPQPAANDDAASPQQPPVSKDKHHASEPVTVSKQPQASRESRLYQAAA